MSHSNLTSSFSLAISSLLFNDPREFPAILLEDNFLQVGNSNFSNICVTWIVKRIQWALGPFRVNSEYLITGEYYSK